MFLSIPAVGSVASVAAVAIVDAGHSVALQHSCRLLRLLVASVVLLCSCNQPTRVAAAARLPIAPQQQPGENLPTPMGEAFVVQESTLYGNLPYCVAHAACDLPGQLPDHAAPVAGVNAAAAAAAMPLRFCRIRSNTAAVVNFVVYLLRYSLVHLNPLLH